MAVFNMFNQFVEDLAHKVHDIENDSLVIALTNVAPVATNSVLANITQISYNLTGDRVVTVSFSGQTGGVYRPILADKLLTANGSNGPFRYAVLYNDTPASPLDPLICWYDYGSSITLSSGETFNVNFDDVNGLFDLQAT